MKEIIKTKPTKNIATKVQNNNKKLIHLKTNEDEIKSTI